MSNKFELIYKNIINDEKNLEYTKKGYKPLYTANENSKIIIIGQAPGIKAQESGMTWNDLSGDNLRSWLGVTKDEFYDVDKFAMIPMDFYYPGKAKTGDLPPRKGFAEKWHPMLFKEMKNVEFILLVGIYAQKFYLNENFQKNLTETVKNYLNYLPKFLPLPHPSPLNFRWMRKNPWFENEVLPILKEKINNILKK